MPVEAIRCEHRDKASPQDGSQSRGDAVEEVDDEWLRWAMDLCRHEGMPLPLPPVPWPPQPASSSHRLRRRWKAACEVREVADRIRRALNACWSNLPGGGGAQEAGAAKQVTLLN